MDVIYRKNYVKADLDDLWNTLPWERRDNTPRHECWMNDMSREYTYGSGRGVRTYVPNAWHPFVLDTLHLLQTEYPGLNVCFINGYLDSKDHLGWHADDSPEIDQNVPIAVISFGASREIWFKPIEAPGSAGHESVLLEHGSLLLMPAGFQNTYHHRIPKADRVVGKRISLTYRGLVKKEV